MNAPQSTENPTELERYARLLSEAEAIHGRSLASDAWRRLKKNRVALAALCFLVGLALLAVLAAFLQRSFYWHSFPVMAVIGTGAILVYGLVMFPVMLSPPCSVYLKPLLHQLWARLGRTLGAAKRILPVTNVGTE